eukprot:417721_1
MDGSSRKNDFAVNDPIEKDAKSLLRNRQTPVCNNDIRTCGYLKILYDLNSTDDISEKYEKKDIVFIMNCFFHFLLRHEDDKLEHTGPCDFSKCKRVQRYCKNDIENKLDDNTLFIQHTFDQVHSTLYHQHDYKMYSFRISQIGKSNNKYNSNDHRTYSYSYPFNYWKHCSKDNNVCFNDITYAELYINPKYQTLKDELLAHSALFPQEYDVKHMYTTELTEVIYTMETNYVRKVTAQCNKYLTQISHFPDHPSHFDYKDGTPILAENILCLKIYCKEDKLQLAFNKTYRPNVYEQKQQTDKDLLSCTKERHSHFHHFARILRETVEVFGTQYINGDVKRMYRGIAEPMIIPGFQCKIFSVLSTSSNIDVARNFVDVNGLVLELVPSTYLKYFSCAPFSHYSFEREFLFIGGLAEMNITMIWKIDPQTTEQYKYHIPALRMFDSMTNGVYFKKDAADIHAIKEKDWCLDTNELEFKDVSDGIKDFVQRFIDYRLSDNRNEASSYIPKVLNEMCYRRKCVQINWQSLNENLLEEIADDGGYIGYKFIKDKICSDEKYVDINIINKIFPKMTNLVILELRNIESLLLEDISKYIKKHNGSKIKINCFELVASSDEFVLTNIDEQYAEYSKTFENIKMERDEIWKTSKIIIRA